ncbi:hypothetical protein Tco_1370759 [Tanacetum coccineum]
MTYPRFTKIIINHLLCIHKFVPKALLSSLHTIKDDGFFSQMKFVRIGEDVQEYGRAIPDAMLTDNIKQSETYKMFIKYSTGLIPPKKTRGKGSQGKKAVVSSKPASVEVSDESDSEAARKQTSSRRVIKKKVSISVEDNIILEPDVALELGKSMSLIEAVEEEAARPVHATHERIVTEFDPEPARRRPSGIAFRDTSSVSKKMSPDPSQKLKGSSEGTGTKLGVPDESTVILKTLSEATGTKPGVPDEEKDTSVAKADIDWVYSDEEEKKDDDDDDYKSIDIEETDDEETDDEFVQGDEYVRDDVDKEMKDAKVAESGNDDEEITDTEKADAEKTEEVKDDNMKAELPPSSFSLSVSLDFGNQFLNLSSDKSIVGNLKDSANAKINSLLDVQIQQKIPQIQSVNAYLGSSLGDAVQKVLQKHTKELKQQYPQQVNYKDIIEESVQANVINEVKNLLPKFLPKAVIDFATLVIQGTVKKALEKTLIVLAQSSSQAQSSLKAAESLSEYKLKMILFEKMDKSRSYLTHDKHQALFDTLFNSLCLDDVITRGQADPEKSLRKRDHDGNEKDKNPSAGPNQGKKTKRRRTKELESSKRTSTTKETSKGNASTKGLKSNKSVHADELVAEPTVEVIMDASNDDVVNDADQPQNDHALKHNWFTQPPMPPTPDP